MYFLRVIHANSENPLDINLNGVFVVKNLSLGESTSYQTIPTEKFHITVCAKDKVIYSASMNMPGTEATLVIASELYLYKDRRLDKEVGKARVRFLHFSPHQGDLKITVDGTVVEENYSYATTPKYYRFSLEKHVWTIEIDGENGFRKVFTTAPTNQAVNTITFINGEIEVINDTPGLIDTFPTLFKLSSFVGKWYYIAGMGLPFNTNFVPHIFTLTHLHDHIKVNLEGVDGSGDVFIHGKYNQSHTEHPSVLQFTFPQMEGYLRNHGVYYIVHEYISNRYALIGSTNRSQLMFLSREETMTTDLYTHLYFRARKLGYNIDYITIRPYATPIFS